MLTCTPSRLFLSRSTSPFCPMFLIAAAAAAASAMSARADILGFNNLQGWEYNQDLGDMGTPASRPDANTVQLTTGSNQLRSIFYSTTQSVTQFNASFTYRANGGGVSRRLAFIIQNAPAGDDTIGTNGHAYQGIANSVAILFDIDSSGRQYVGYYTGGIVPSLGELTPVNSRNRDILVSVSYAGGNFLALSLTDVLDPNLIFDRNFVLPASITTSVAGDTAYVGFGASTFGAADQIVSNFSFVVPSPNAAAVLGLSGLMAARRRR